MEDDVQLPRWALLCDSRVEDELPRWAALAVQRTTYSYRDGRCTLLRRSETAAAV